MLANTIIKALRDRWIELPAISLREALASPGLQSPFGKTEAGHVDFRGYSVDESLHKMVVEGVDFSYCLLGASGQFAATVKSSLFVAASLEGNLGTDFEDCDFSSASLKESWLRGAFRRCAFGRADMSSACSSQTEFDACCFDGANLRKSSFYECRFARCSFIGAEFGSGSLADSTFSDCAFCNPDLSKVVLDGTRGIAT